MPHISAAEAAKIVLVVLAILGAGRILALSHQDSALSQAFLLLY